jgi:hypothetical protein
VETTHLPSYLNEFVFRFNRRRSRSRRLVFYRVLELAVGHQPVRYHDPHRQQTATKAAVCAATDPRESAKPGAPTSEPAVEDR